MTVAELIARLQQIDGNRQVIMARDAGGNSYSPLSSLWTGAYRPETTWYGEAGLDVLTSEDRERGYTEEDVITDGQSAIFLCPVN